MKCFILLLFICNPLKTFDHLEPTEFYNLEQSLQYRVRPHGDSLFKIDYFDDEHNKKVDWKEAFRLANRVKPRELSEIDSDELGIIVRSIETCRQREKDIGAMVNKMDCMQLSFYTILLYMRATTTWTGRAKIYGFEQWYTILDTCSIIGYLLKMRDNQALAPARVPAKIIECGGAMPSVIRLMAQCFINDLYEDLPLYAGMHLLATLYSFRADSRLNERREHVYYIKKFVEKKYKIKFD